MSRKKEPSTPDELVPVDEADAHPDLKALVRAVRRIRPIEGTAKRARYDRPRRVITR